VLIDAALTIAHEQGLSAVGVRSLCAQTKLNQRYFYESFDTVDDVLIAALDTIVGELLVAGFAALHDRRHRARLTRATHGMRIALGVILDDPRKATLLGAISAGPEALQDAFRQRIAQVSDAILADPEAADQGFDRATALYVAAGSAQLIVACLAGEVDLDRDALADKLARLAIGATGHRIS
jgi:AcrR family transcriptional regulator